MLPWMNLAPYTHVALTAFLEPYSQGDLWVWSANRSEILSLCQRKASTDPHGHLMNLAKDCSPAFNHAGRELGEELLSEALMSIGAVGIEPASRWSPRQALLSIDNQSLDCERGFVDFLVSFKESGRIHRRLAGAELRHAVEDRLYRLWGLNAQFCGWVQEEQWDDYSERACAIKSLIDRSEIEQSSSNPASERSDHRL